jgi:hypothetical protein
LRTAQCGRTPRMLGAITFHFFHRGHYSIHRPASVGSTAISCSHSPFKRKARPGRMCALLVKCAARPPARQSAPATGRERGLQLSHD